MPSLTHNRSIVWIFLLFLFFEISKSRPLMGLDSELVLNSLTSLLNLSGGSRLGLLNMLTGEPLITPDGGAVSEGDIVKYHTQTKGMKDDGDLWPDGVIPYMFHSSVDDEHKNLVKEAMSHWEEHTCIRFRSHKQKDKHFIRFRSDTSGCWSAVGRRYDKSGPQDISLGVGCFKFYTAIHEIGHTLGYYHEHSRTDRDKFVEILWDNVKPGMNVQFQLKSTRNEIYEYDYRSIMHYPAWAFSKTPLKENVVLSKDPFSQYQIDEEKNSLSLRDIKLTNMLYKCNEKCPNLRQIQCLNGGVLTPNTKGKDCSCLCPPGISGKMCEKIEGFVSNGPKCGGNVTDEGIISTPNYPFRKKEFESCSYWIRAPIDHRVKVFFEDFSFSDPYGGSENSIAEGLCIYESVDIRKSFNIYKGSIYCGQQIQANTYMESEGRDFIIIIIADDQKKGRGFKARVDFVYDKDQSIKMENALKAEQVIVTKKPKKSTSLIDVLDSISIL